MSDQSNAKVFAVADNVPDLASSPWNAFLVSTDGSTYLATSWHSVQHALRGRYKGIDFKLWGWKRFRVPGVDLGVILTEGDVASLAAIPLSSTVPTGTDVLTAVDWGGNSLSITRNAEPCERPPDAPSDFPSEAELKGCVCGETACEASVKNGDSGSPVFDSNGALFGELPARHKRCVVMVPIWTGLPLKWTHGDAADGATFGAFLGLCKSGDERVAPFSSMVPLEDQPSDGKH